MANVETFKKNLADISYARAGWDYEMSAAQRAEERRIERAALDSAREIWAKNPGQHSELRDVFHQISPLATLNEIDRQN
jgi:gamma-glutamyltranspeptidase